MTNDQLTLSAKLNATFTLYREHLATFVLISAIVAVPATLLSQYCIEIAKLHWLHDMSSFVETSIAAGLAMLFSIPAFFLQSSAIDVATAEACLGGKPTVGSAYNGALAKIGQIIVVSLLYGLITMFGFIAFVVPGFIFMVRYAYALPIVIVEGLPAKEALTRSAELTEGRKGNLFAMLLVLGLVSGIITKFVMLMVGDIHVPLIGAVLRAIPAMLTAPLAPLAIMLDYLAARSPAEPLQLQLGE